jgi:molybdopterin molybdotransferase
MPAGTDAVHIQENCSRDGSFVIINAGSAAPGHVRPRGGDFVQGQTLLAADTVMTARRLTLAAAMGHAAIPVYRRPTVAILASGDELVLPGVTPGPDQIVCSNPFGVAALVTAAGGLPLFLGIAGDTHASLDAAIDRATGCDLLITIGGASVGDHDLIGPVLQKRGMALDFWKIAMRPGKPMLFGRLGTQRVVGLPGNPVSSLICARVFLVPLIERLSGRSTSAQRTIRTIAATDLDANGERTHYMRATLDVQGSQTLVRPVRSQDSSLLSPLSSADCLIVRPVGAPAVVAGQTIDVLSLDF